MQTTSDSHDETAQALSTGAMRATKKLIIVSSPKAGSGAGRERIPQLVELARQEGIDVLNTTSIDELRGNLDGADDAALEQTVVIAAGGDGTLSLVAENTPAEVAIVPMPFGTENLLARYFGHTNSPSEILRTIRSGKSHRMDAGRANGKLFLVMATCGFDAEVVRGVHLRRKGHISRLSYFRPLLRALYKYRFPEILVTSKGDDGFQDKCGWAMVFNLPKYGGFLSIEPEADGADGRLDVINFSARSKLRSLLFFLGIATRLHTTWQNGVFRTRVAKITISAPSRVPYQLDGDYAGRLPLSIETIPGRVHLLLPPGNPAK